MADAEYGGGGGGALTSGPDPNGIYYDAASGSFKTFGGDSLVSGNSDGSPPTQTYQDPYTTSSYSTGGYTGGYSGGAAAPAYSQEDLNSFNSQKGNIYSSSEDWAKHIYGPSYEHSIDSYINDLKHGQGSLNNRAVQNELAYKQGRTGILGMVSRGIRSGGVMLANRNAADSSASAALASAYGEIGRGQLSNIGNQRAVEAHNIEGDQNIFNDNRDLAINGMKTDLNTAIAVETGKAQDKLAALDAWAADKSLPERIAVEREKAQIQSSLRTILTPFYAELDNRAGGVGPTSQEDRLAEAQKLSLAGTVADNPFNFSSSTPATMQSSPTSSQLPLYLAPSKKKE